MPSTNPNPVVMAKKQKRFLDSLRDHLGIVSKAARAINVTPQTIYNWRKAYPDFAKQMDAIEDYTLDEVENVALKMITEEHNPAMTIFYLKTKGKKRGYIERVEMEHTNGDLKTFRESLNELVIEHESTY